jgi:hemolysin activation/secretion protein
MPRLLRIVPRCCALAVGTLLFAASYGQSPEPVTAAPANDPSAIMTPELKGLRLIPALSQLRGAPPAGRRVVVEGLPWLDPAKVEAISARYLSRPLTRGDLSHLLTAIVVLCRGADRPVVDVYAPPQDMTGGIAQIVVFVAKLGKVRVQGNKWFSDDHLTGQVTLKPGQEVTQQTLMQDVDWLNQNPFRRVDLQYAMGEQPGETDAVLHVNDARPERFYAGYDDSGNQETGLGRVFAGFNLANLWGADNELDYQYTRSTDWGLLEADSASYTLPLPWRNTLTVFGAWVRAVSETDYGNPSNQAGISWEVGLRYAIPLPALTDYTQSLVFGFDYKWTNNNLGYGGVQVFTSPVNIAQVLVTYSGVEVDTHGSTRGSVSMYFSPGGDGGTNNDLDFGAQRTGAVANYEYWHVSFSRLQRLPGDFSAALSILGQCSTARLLPTEQFGLGGEDSVRGYDDHVVNGDYGISEQLEFRTPTRHLLGSIPDQSQALVFVDAGRDWQHDFQAGDGEYTLVSAGPGLRAQIGTHGTIKADYGWQLRRLPGTSSGRIQLSAVLTF